VPGKGAKAERKKKRTAINSLGGRRSHDDEGVSAGIAGMRKEKKAIVGRLEEKQKKYRRWFRRLGNPNRRGAEV